MSDSEDDVPSNAAAASSEDVFKIMLATDIHLGYNEKDAIRGEDSFTTFDEVLSIAAKEEVDFILLGGDLFHDSKPSISCIHKAMSLIKKYCLGDKPVAIEFLSDQSQNFKHCVNPVVNYEDPNLNISIPIFSIHGNHDDPSGFGRACTLDILSASGLVNYFGKVEDLSEIKITPLLMKKGESQLAIYGLSYIKDERLSRLFRDKKVHMYTQSGASEDEWFNIFVCHQNRADRGVGKHLSEDVLPTLIDLVFWGHEHDCRVQEEHNPRRQFYVTQPGSTVATSLAEGEAMEKHVAILYVNKKEFKLTPVKLKTVRPFVFDTLILSECNLPDNNDSPSDNVREYITDHLEKMFTQVETLRTGHPKQPTRPLLRLRVDYSSEDQMFNTIRYGQEMQDRVANPADMLVLRREPVNRKGKLNGFGEVDADAMDAALEVEHPRSVWDSKMERVIEQYFQEAKETQKLEVLSVRGMCEAVTQFIRKGDTDAIADVVKSQINKTVTFLTDHAANEATVPQLLETFRDLRAAKPDEEVAEARAALASTNRRRVYTDLDKDPDDAIIIGDSDDEFREADAVTSSRGRARGRGRGSRPRGTPATRRGRGRNATATVQLSLADSFSSNRSTRRPARRGATFDDEFDSD